MWITWPTAQLQFTNCAYTKRLQSIIYFIGWAGAATDITGDWPGLYSTERAPKTMLYACVHYTYHEGKPQRRFWGGVACPRGTDGEVNLIRVIFLAETRVRETLRSSVGVVELLRTSLRRSGNIFHDYRPLIRRWQWERNLKTIYYYFHGENGRGRPAYLVRI